MASCSDRSLRIPAVEIRLLPSSVAAERHQPPDLSGTEIPLLSRILQVADIYDALTTERPYKRAFSREEAITTLEEEMGRGWREGSSPCSR